MNNWVRDLELILGCLITYVVLWIFWKKQSHFRLAIRLAAVQTDRELSAGRCTRSLSRTLLRALVPSQDGPQSS